MKREDIERSAFKYANDNQVDVGLGGELKKGFVAGAEWRINSVWHDITEKPKRSRAILVLYNTAGAVGVWYPDFEDVLKRFNKYHIMKWAYVDDLLPNKEDEK